MKYIILVLLIIIGYFLACSTLSCFGIIPFEPHKIPIVLNNTDEYTLAVASLIGWDFGSLFWFIISLIIFSYLFGAYRYLARKQKAKSTVNKECVTRPYILYLRSFADEKATKKIIRRFSDSRSEEEMLIDAFSDIAPVYAIGDPADKRMPYGASRIYVDDSIWKSTVEELAVNAEIVVLRLGRTNNFWWEVNMALKKVPIEKIVFVIPWSKNFNNVATLYKILLEHNIDISSLNVTVDKKRYGSISSVLYFNNGKPESQEIVFPRFTGVFLSYDNMLRNALAGFRENFGFHTKRKSPIIKSRVLTVILILTVILGTIGSFFGHLMELKYQRPYELVEECIKDQSFSSQFGNEVNGTNLTRAILGCIHGELLLSDSDFIQMYIIENNALSQMSVTECEQIYNEPYNLFLIIKKYAPEDYSEYVKLAAKAASKWMNNPEDGEAALLKYKLNIDNLPQWVYSFFDRYKDLSVEESDKYWREETMKHIYEPGFSDVIKTIMAQNINAE